MASNRPNNFEQFRSSLQRNLSAVVTACRQSVWSYRPPPGNRKAAFRSLHQQSRPIHRARDFCTKPTSSAGWKMRKPPFHRVKTESANHSPSANRFSRLRYTESPLAMKEKLRRYYLPPSAISFRKIRVHRLVPFGHVSGIDSTD